MPAPRETTRRKRNSSKVNLIVSVVFHAVLIGALFYFAAREGMLGKKLKTYSRGMLALSFLKPTENVAGNALLIQ